MIVGLNDIDGVKYVNDLRDMMDTYLKMFSGKKPEKFTVRSDVYEKLKTRAVALVKKRDKRNKNPVVELMYKGVTLKKEEA